MNLQDSETETRNPAATEVRSFKTVGAREGRSARVLNRFVDF